MDRRRRVVVLLLLGVLLLPVVAAPLFLPRRLFRPYNLPAPPPRAPLVSIAVHQVQWKDCKGVEAVLQSGTFLCDVINCDVFEGFTPGISADVARTHYGTPAGEWNDPSYNVPAYYYEGPAGRISLGLAPDSGQGHWVTVAYPKRSACKDVMEDTRLLAQALEIKGTDDEIYFTLRPANGAPGGLGLHIKGNNCDSLELHGIEPKYRRTAAQR
jgi:hypothetical protein